MSQSGERRPVRFFYGARTSRDLFHLDEFAGSRRAPSGLQVSFPALSHAEANEGWTGETGFVHDVVARTLRAGGAGGRHRRLLLRSAVPMIDAVLPVLQMAGVEPERIYFDKFTPATR